VVDDWQAETRFSPEIGLSLGLHSGACVVVGRAEAPFGVLMAVADAPRCFGEEDIGLATSTERVLPSAARLPWAGCPAAAPAPAPSSRPVICSISD
jgi:hypothetical protein